MASVASFAIALLNADSGREVWEAAMEASSTCQSRFTPAAAGTGVPWPYF